MLKIFFEKMLQKNLTFSNKIFNKEKILTKKCGNSMILESKGHIFMIR